MRLLALSSIILAGTLATTAFAAPNESLNYNVINLSADARRDISNDEMHAVLYLEKSHKQPAQLASQINQLMNQAMVTARKYPTVKIETRSEEHTSELQSRENLVCRLLLEK